jgi:hypothetical protein
MECTYKLTISDSVILRSDGTYIPINEANTDYQAYLAFLADGGVPEPADEAS